MTISKYWGDERHKDAVYAIYLKKVRYVPPPGYEGLPHYRPIDPDSYYLTQDIGSDQLQWETIRERVIKAGTLEKLVESLVATDEKLDSRHFNVFFATYRGFGRPDEVTNILIEWFERLETEDSSGGPGANPRRSSASTKTSVQSTIRSIFICWLDMYPEDFYDHDDYKFPLLCSLIDFSKRHSLLDLKHRARKLRERHRRVAEDGGLAAQLPTIEQYTYSLDYDPNDMIYAQERAQMFDISKDNCVQIAEQLTFWDCLLFRELRPYQCQGAIWGRRNKKHANNVYSVRATIEQFNAVSQRVMTSIVLPDCRPEFRARIIEKWIEIAKELRALKNFSALKAVISSLQSEPVFRIKSAWACVSKASNMLFRDLTTMFEHEETATSSDERSRDHVDSDSSGGKGSKRISQCRRTKSDVNLADSQCSVPYLGSFLTDLMMIDQAVPDMTDDGLINFEKRRREFEVMAKIRLYQSAARSYTIPMDHAFCAWFYYLPTVNENDCFQRSIEVEPGPNNSTPDLRRNRNNHSATSNGTKMNSITRMFGYLADEISTKSSSLINSAGGHFSNDSGIHTEESMMAATSNSPQSPPTNNNNSSAVAMALISRGKMLATPGVSGVLTSTPMSGWRSSSHSASEFNPQAMQFSPQHSAQRSDPTTERLKDAPTRNQHTNNSANCSPCMTPLQNGSSLDTPTSHSNRGSFQNNNNLNRRMAGQQSTSSHTSTSSATSSVSTHHRQGSSTSCTSPATSSNTSTIFSNGIPPSGGSGAQSLNFHLARVGLDDRLQSENSGPMYKCIKIENGDRMSTLIERALEKHMMLEVKDKDEYCLVQLLPDGGEFRLPDHCNPFYAVAPDPSSPMLNFILRSKEDERVPAAPSAKKINRQKRSNLTKWNSGYL